MIITTTVYLTADGGISVNVAIRTKLAALEAEASGVTM